MTRFALRAAVLAGVLATLASPCRAQSPATQASVAAIILQNLPTNGQQQIAASALRTTLNAMNSAIFQSNPAYTVPIGVGINLNSVADTPFSFFLPNGLPNFVGPILRLYNCSASASSASVAIYTGAGATGFALIPVTAVTITTAGVNAANTAQAVSNNTVYSNSTSLFFRVTTAQGSPVTCSAALEIRPTL